MNRAQRRRLQRQGVTKDDLQKCQQDITDNIMTLLLAIPLKVAREKLKFGPKRLEQFAEDITDEYQSFVDGDMSLDEYAAFVYEAIGWSFQRGS